MNTGGGKSIAMLKEERCESSFATSEMRTELLAG
jgi:hypothetical protein